MMMELDLNNYRARFYHKTQTKVTIVATLSSSHWLLMGYGGKQINSPSIHNALLSVLPIPSITKNNKEYGTVQH